MFRTCSKRAITLGIAALLCLITVASHAAPTVKNTSTYVGDGRWNWTIFVDADPGTLQQIECVTYNLHPTFQNPIQKVCNQPNEKFKYTANGWGTFIVEVRIEFKDGRIETLKHPLVFKQETKQTGLAVIPKNWSKQIEQGWWEWGIYVDGANTELDRIRCVEYTLHPTFPNSVRVICDRAKRFQLVARGWGTFTVGIKVMLKDNSVYQLSHALEFR